MQEHLEIKLNQIELAALPMATLPMAKGLSDDSLPRPEHVNSRRTNLRGCLCSAHVVRTSYFAAGWPAFLASPLPHLKRV